MPSLAGAIMIRPETPSGKSVSSKDDCNGLIVMSIE